VFWTSLGNNALPAHIVARFANKTMAITGYEMDQVIVSPAGSPGLHSEQDVSVPINWAYNHHYMFWLTGSAAEMVTVAARPDDTSAHGAPTRQEARITKSKSNIYCKIDSTKDRKKSARGLCACFSVSVCCFVSVFKRIFRL